MIIEIEALVCKVNHIYKHWLPFKLKSHVIVLFLTKQNTINRHVENLYIFEISNTLNQAIDWL